MEVLSCDACYLSSMYILSVSEDYISFRFSLGYAKYFHFFSTDVIALSLIRIIIRMFVHFLLLHWFLII